MTTTKLPIDNKLKSLLEKTRKAHGYDKQACVINFRSPDYSAEQGGFHPVELMLDADGELMYLTDFAYDGHTHFSELVKELDWDFTHDYFEQGGCSFPMAQSAELFEVYQDNFLAYHAMGVYEIEVQAC